MTGGRQQNLGTGEMSLELAIENRLATVWNGVIWMAVVGDGRELSGRVSALERPLLAPQSLGVVVLRCGKIFQKR